MLIVIGLLPDTGYPVGNKPAMASAIREEHSRQPTRMRRLKCHLTFNLALYFPRPLDILCTIGGSGY